MTDYIVPVLLFLAAALALGKRENAYDLLLQGGADGGGADGLAALLQSRDDPAGNALLRQGLGHDPVIDTGDLAVGLLPHIAAPDAQGVGYLFENFQVQGRLGPHHLVRIL